MNEETPDNLSNIQPEDLPDENNSQQEIKIITPNQETEIMEVHHHPDLHHKPKHLKEYLLEFLMIFLAVTLGFFAETIREKISENHREKDYIVGLINNAQSDISNLNELISANELEVKGIDSLMRISKNNFMNIPVQDSIFYFAVKYTSNLHIFTYNDLTLVQLRNAGGYSLIKTDKVADTIAQYEYKNNNILLQERFYTDSYLQTWSCLKQVFDGSLSGKFFHEYDSTNKIPSDMHVLATRDEEKMLLLYSNYWTFAGTLNGYNNMLKEHLKYLEGFIIFLKRTYNIGKADL
jgi:hypothetical protein